MHTHTEERFWRSSFVVDLLFASWHERMSDRDQHSLGYARDGMHVYYHGERVPAMIGTMFNELSCGYACDPFRVCFAGQLIEGAHPQTFEVLDDGYAKDPYHVYYQGKVMPGLMAQSFVTLGNGYAKDARQVYYCGKKAEGVNPSALKTSRPVGNVTFQIITSIVSK